MPPLQVVIDSALTQYVNLEIKKLSKESVSIRAHLLD
jgi:hypothetical protein